MNAQQLREDILEKKYDRAAWQGVLRDHFGATRLAERPELAGEIKGLKSVLATAAYELGSFETAEGRLIGIYEVEVAPRVQLHRNRVGLRELLGKVIRDTVDGALIVFVQGDKWRFSYVSEIYTRDASGKRQQKKTDPRRYTYLLGKGERAKTAADRFARLDPANNKTLFATKGITLEALELAFNVEKMSKAFFDEYRSHYDKFVAYLTGEDRKGNKTNNASPALKFAFNGDKKSARDFVKKLLGRVVFLYFLEKKGWLGVPQGQPWGAGDEDFLHKLYKDCGDKGSFYATVLAPLFFETLNQQRSGDRFSIDASLFKSEGWDKLKIPFLNGGLFEPEPEPTRAIAFPKDYFSLLFSFFDQYNFTVYEDSPEEHTVAVDPEMLGHIFENLLEDNKDKGAFYTPKEIVHYMCGESLIEYLNTYLGGAAPREAIELFIRQGIGGGISAHTEDILTALRAVKICDPAIGSGAFPMGILLEIFHAVEVLWDVNPDTTRRIWNLTADKWEHAAAKVKADIIQHSIYGVDIEQGAVDIARLRFWLSLVVDEEEPKPLPNLDYKIMVGNSLISKYEGQVIDIDWEVKLGSAITDETKKAKALQEGVAEKLGKLFEKQHQYFNYKGNKAKLQHEIRDLKIDVLIAQLQLTKYKADQDKVAQGSMFGGLSSAAQKKAKASLETTVLINASISQLRTLKSGNKPLEFFDWKLDFPEVMNKQDGKENGFDIVIGNPPYIQLQKLGSYTDELQQKKLKTFARTGDIYCLFYEIGFEILKKSGFLNYITSNSWLRAAYGEPLRTYLLESTNPVSLIDFGNYKVFENATVNINILIAQRADNEHRAKACLITKAIGSLENLSVHLQQLRNQF